MTHRRLAALGAVLALASLPGCSTDNAGAAPPSTPAPQQAPSPSIPPGLKLYTAASGHFSLLLPATATDATRRQGASAEELTMAGRVPPWSFQVTSQAQKPDMAAVTLQHCTVTAQDEGGLVADGVSARFGGEDAKGCRVTSGNNRTTWYLAANHHGRTYLVMFSTPQPAAGAKKLAEPSIRSWTWHDA